MSKTIKTDSDLFLEVISDRNRIRILSILFMQSMNVSDIHEVLDINQSNISRHLSRLRNLKMVECKCYGAFTYYWFSPQLDGLIPIVNNLIETIIRKKFFESDLEKMKNWYEKNQAKIDFFSGYSLRKDTEMTR